MFTGKISNTHSRHVKMVWGLCALRHGNQKNFVWTMTYSHRHHQHAQQTFDNFCQILKGICMKINFCHHSPDAPVVYPADAFVSRQAARWLKVQSFYPPKKLRTRAQFSWRYRRRLRRGFFSAGKDKLYRLVARPPQCYCAHSCCLSNFRLLRGAQMVETKALIC